MSEDRAAYIKREGYQSKCTITINFDDKTVHFSQRGDVGFKYIAFAFARYMVWFLKTGIVCDDNLIEQARKGFLIEFDSALADPECWVPETFEKFEEG